MTCRPAPRIDMKAKPPLPSFAQPPLDEVAAGMQFMPLPIRAADVGAWHGLIAKDYPNTLDVPALPPSFETFGPVALIPPPFPFSVAAGLLPRSWFISPNDEHVIQLQADRLIVNWRMRPSGGAYPRYQEVRRRFLAAGETLLEFCRQRELPSLVANQCELTYFNKIPLPEDAEWGDLNRLFSGMLLTPGPEWRGRFSDGHLLLRTELRQEGQGPFGRLQIECMPTQIDLSQKAWALNIFVRGRPETADLAGVIALLDMAHDEIVTCFTSITNQDMHSRWGRER
jgi:uncharacterized protein (TIGR04255 family)